LWTVYPKDHIGRITGTAYAYTGTLNSGNAGSRIKPSWPWSCDGNALGSNDFRATRRQIYWASMVSKDGNGIMAVSDGTQSIRSWIMDNNVRFLIADYSNYGSDEFIRQLASKYERPLKTGDTVEGKIKLQLILK